MRIPSALALLSIAAATALARPAAADGADFTGQVAPEIQLSDVHYTILKQVFGYTGASFGAGNKIVSAILA